MEPNGHRKMRRSHLTAQESSSLNLSEVIDELDPWTAWAYRPHTIKLLFIGTCFLM